MSSQAIAAVAAVSPVLILALAALAVILIRERHKRGQSLTDRIKKHFGNLAQDRLEVHSREFPSRVTVDAHRALEAWISQNCQTHAALGVPASGSFLESVDMGNLLAPIDKPLQATALKYDSFDVGEEETVSCVKHALWLLDSPAGRLAILWTSATVHGGCGFETKLRIEAAHPAGPREAAQSKAFFRSLELAIQGATTYRGKILSLEADHSYMGHAGSITVHKLRSVAREDVILPETTIRLLERNVIRFVDQRPELAKIGMPTKKGVLFYGPPGTGKTHTIHYLIGALKGHTTLLVTAEQMGMLDEYMALARLLVPSILVLEDIDLIGRSREQMDAGRESLLNKLLNEMDGLRADAEILFLMTTNRPESLEQALASRPGRIDQAIEFPLPDEVGRKKLIRLYAAGASIADDVVQQTARATSGVSASFIKELMRRAIQFHLECRVGDGAIRILQNDIDQALEELLFVGGSLNRTLLGAGSTDSGE